MDFSTFDIQYSTFNIFDVSFSLIHNHIFFFFVVIGKTYRKQTKEYMKNKWSDHNPRTAFFDRNYPQPQETGRELRCNNNQRSLE